MAQLGIKATDLGEANTGAAKFGIKATDLGEANTGAAKFVRQPVSDNSSNILLAAAGDMAIEAWGGYNLSELDTDIKDAAEEYKLRDIDPEVATGGMAEAAGLRKGVDSLWDTLDDVNMDTVNKMETSIRGNLEKYKTAYEQGRMSSDELIARINTATKSAISRQPGLARELVSQAEFYSNLAGVTDHVAAAKTMEKNQIAAADEIRKSENRVLEEAGYPINAVGGEREEYLAQARAQVRGAKQMDAFLKGAAILDAQGKLNEQVIDNEISSPEATASRSASLLQMSSTVSNNVTSGAYVEKYKTQGMNAADANLRGITEEFATQRTKLSAISNRASDKGRRVIEGHIKQLDEMEKLYKDVASGGPEAQRAQNLLTARQSTLRLTTATLEHRLDLANKGSAALANLSQAGMQVQDPTVWRNVMGPLAEEMQNFFNGYTASPLNSLDYTTKNGQVAGKFIFSSQNPVNDPLRLPAEVISANDKTIAGNLTMLKATEDPVKFMQAMDMWTQTIVQEAATSGEPISSRYSPDKVAEVNKFLGDAFANARTSGTLSYDKATNTFVVLNPDKTTNADRTKRVNTMFKAFISFNGHKLDAKIDDVAGTLLRVSNYKPPVEVLKEQNKGPLSTGEFSKEQLKALGVDVPPKKDDMKISPKMQAERDKTRLRVLRMEIDDASKQLQKETNPEKRKMLEDNIKFVTEELDALEKAK